MADGRENNPSPLPTAGATGAGGGGGTPCHLPLIIITVAAEPGGEAGKAAQGGKAKSCCSILSKIMKPTPLAPLTRAALPAPATVPPGPPGRAAGAALGACAAEPGPWGIPGQRPPRGCLGVPQPAGPPPAPGRAPRPLPPQLSCRRWGQGNMDSVRSKPPPGGSRRGRKGVPDNTGRRSAAERRKRRRRQALLRGARSCSCSSPGEWGGRAEPSHRAQPRSKRWGGREVAAGRAG